MIWINKDNTKPLYILSIEDIILSIEDIIARSYSEDIRISKTNDILMFSVSGNIATLVKGSVNDKKHLMHRELLGVKLLYESEKPDMFAILFNDTRIIASDKKILLDTVRTILMKKEKNYYFFPFFSILSDIILVFVIMKTINNSIIIYIIIPSVLSFNA